MIQLAASEPILSKRKIDSLFLLVVPILPLAFSKVRLLCFVLNRLWLNRLVVHSLTSFSTSYIL